MRSALRAPGAVLAAASAALLFITRAAAACPDCAPGQQARAMFAGSDWWSLLAAMALPAIAIGLISGALFRGGAHHGRP